VRNRKEGRYRGGRRGAWVMDAELQWARMQSKIEAIIKGWLRLRGGRQMIVLLGWFASSGVGWSVLEQKVCNFLFIDLATCKIDIHFLIWGKARGRSLLYCVNPEQLQTGFRRLPWVKLLTTTTFQPWAHKTECLLRCKYNVMLYHKCAFSPQYFYVV
jgi:hypothetical protein